MTREVIGVIPPLTTPFTKSGDVYEEGLRRLVDFQIEKGVHGLFVCGTYGSGPIMTVQERKQCHEIAVDPEFESPVAVDYTYASGLGFLMAIPLILIIPMPLRTYTTGNMIYSWIAFGIIGFYLLFVLVSYALITRKRALGQKRKLWFRVPELVQQES